MTCRSGTIIFECLSSLAFPMVLLSDTGLSGIKRGRQSARSSNRDLLTTWLSKHVRKNYSESGNLSRELCSCSTYHSRINSCGYLFQMFKSCREREEIRSTDHPRRRLRIALASDLQPSEHRISCNVVSLAPFCTATCLSKFFQYCINSFPSARQYLYY